MDTKKQLLLLGRPGHYEAQIERLRGKYRHGDRLYAAFSDGLSPASASMHSRKLARILAKTVSRGEYAFGPAREREAFIDHKRRLLYRASLTDTVVAGVLANVTGALIQPYLSRCVYSYQKGRSFIEVITDFARFLDRHRRAHPDPRTRGLYVIKRDISAYGESIPVTGDSSLWLNLKRAFAANGGVPQSHPLWLLTRAACRPEIITLSGEHTRFDAGVPTGSPIQPVMCNLYLSPLDQGLDTVEGGFYARYGDDILFAHPDLETANWASKFIAEKTASLRLSIKKEKQQDLYFTGPGRPSETWTESRPASHIEYLGCKVAFTGQVSLKTEKLRRLLVGLKERVRATAQIMDGTTHEETCAAVVHTVNQTLSPRCNLSLPDAVFLHALINDRTQLKHIDYLVARMAAETISGIRGDRAFRHVPYRELREKWGLSSLVVKRNRRDRANREGTQ